MKKHNIKVNGATVSIIGDVANEDAYISLTDIAKYKNPDFNRMEFQTVRSEPGRLIMTPSQWRKENVVKGMSPNIRDYATTEELVVLINLEDTNADLLRQGIDQIDRLKLLREKAYRQLNILKNNSKALDKIKHSLISDNSNCDKID